MKCIFMLEEIRKCLEEAHSLALFGHENIDWDALGSVLWFWALLEKQSKEVSYFTPNKPGHVYDFLNLWDKIRTEFDYWKYDVLVNILESLHLLYDMKSILTIVKR